MASASSAPHHTPPGPSKAGVIELTNILDLQELDTFYNDIATEWERNQYGRAIQISNPRSSTQGYILYFGIVNLNSTNIQYEINHNVVDTLNHIHLQNGKFTDADMIGSATQKYGRPSVGHKQLCLMSGIYDKIKQNKLTAIQIANKLWEISGYIQSQILGFTNLKLPNKFGYNVTTITGSMETPPHAMRNSRDTHVVPNPRLQKYFTDKSQFLFIINDTLNRNPLSYNNKIMCNTLYYRDRQDFFNKFSLVRTASFQEEFINGLDPKKDTFTSTKRHIRKVSLKKNNRHLNFGFPRLMDSNDPPYKNTIQDPKYVALTNNGLNKLKEYNSLRTKAEEEEQAKYEEITANMPMYRDYFKTIKEIAETVATYSKETDDCEENVTDSLKYINFLKTKFKITFESDELKEYSNIVFDCNKEVKKEIKKTNNYFINADSSIKNLETYIKSKPEKRTQPLFDSRDKAVTYLLSTVSEAENALKRANDAVVKAYLFVKKFQDLEKDADELAKAAQAAEADEDDEEEATKGTKRKHNNGKNNNKSQKHNGGSRKLTRKINKKISNKSKSYKTAFRKV